MINQILWFIYSTSVLVVKLVILTSLWMWFITPLGVVSVTYIHMWGLLIFYNLFTIKRLKNIPDIPVEEKFKGTTTVLFIYLILGYFGWVSSWFI